MNCRRFERDLADWLGGRLPALFALQMQAHAAGCAACSRLAEGERSLRTAWRELPPVGEAPDLWPQLAARIAEPRENRAVRSPWFAWLPEIGPSLRYGVAGAAAALVLATVVMTHLPMPIDHSVAVGPVASAPADENHVIQLVSDRQSTLPEAEGDLRIIGTARYREAERYALGVTSAP